MNARNASKYARFKAVNGVIFGILGAVILVRVVMVAGFRLEALPGIVLGAAMIALGVHRMLLIRRPGT